MRPVAALLTGVAAVAVPVGANAGAWAQPKGMGQVIVKYEDMRAEDGFDPDGERADLPAERRDASAGVFAEYGLTERLTLQFKGDWQDGRDAFVDYEGRGPLELGVTWQAWRKPQAAISLYAGYAAGGEGRNAGYATPGVGEHDLEVRVSLGASFNGSGRWRLGRSFVELQAARRMRDGLPDETRADLTFGRHLGSRWMVLNQIYSGATDDGGARWAQTETSIVRTFGPWRVQAGWRTPLAGRETPASRGPIIALWRSF